MRLGICAIGSLKGTPFQEAFTFFQRRMVWSLKVVEREVKFPTADPLTRKRKETQQLTQHTPQGFSVVVLDPCGQDTSSQELAEFLGRLQHQSISPAFWIGGAEGICEEILHREKKIPIKRIAFGRATWPHLLVRVMLMEQLYRAQQLLHNHPYHRG